MKQVLHLGRSLTALQGNDSSGQMQHRERKGDDPWVDTTQREIDWHKKTIGMYGGLIRKLRAEHGE